MGAVDSTLGPASGPMVPQPGEVIAEKYRVSRVVGSGGMGVVLAATHLQLGQEVAIKVLTTDESRLAEATARFLREGRVAAALHSDHVVRIHDVGTLDSGAPYMVMELLRGCDLAARLAGCGRLAVGEAARYVQQACDAIAEAHDHGVIHRDLKPSNLFLTQRSDGTPLVKVLDFGISKTKPEAGSSSYAGTLTTTRTVMGSPAYMSPEQVRNAKDIDHRSDVWSLGVILYELLAGRPPFDADTLPAVCAAIAADPVRPLSELRNDVPAGLAAVVERCVAKDPAARYQSATDLATALTPFAARADDQLFIGPGGARLLAPAGDTRSAAPTLRAADPVEAEPITRSGPRVIAYAVDPVASSQAAEAATLMSGYPAPTGAHHRRARQWKIGLLASTGAVLIIGLALSLWPEAQPETSVPQAPPSGPTDLAEASDFALLIESTPPGAEVYESNHRLGSTPLQLQIDSASVRSGPRSFELRYPGHQTHRLEQGPSVADVRVHAGLSPLPNPVLSAEPLPAEPAPQPRPRLRPEAPPEAPVSAAPPPDIRLQR